MKLSQPQVLRAEESYRYDYWFAPDAVYRVKVIPYAFVLLSFVGAYIGLGALAQVLPSNLWFVGLLAVFVMLHFMFKRIANNKRKATGVSPSKEILENQKVARKIPWEEIKGINLTRKRNVRISVGNHMYKARINKHDYEPLKAFLLAKIGDRLNAREGAL